MEIADITQETSSPPPSGVGLVKKLLSSAVIAVCLALGLTSIAFAQAEPTIRIGYAKCAHCTPVSLMPQFATGITIEAIGFNTGSDALTALVTKNIDIAQSTYQSYAVAMDRGFDVVAISGHVNGGSQILVGNDLPTKEGDWEGLKHLIDSYRAQGKPFRVGASRGNAQDLQMRGAMLAHGIDPNKDVQFINIPNPPDHMEALRRGEVELICTVEPFATQIRQLGVAKLFAYPYDQDTGNLTGLFLTRPDVLVERPKDVEAAIRAWLRVDDLISHDKDAWADVIVKISGAQRPVAVASIDNLFPDRAMHRAMAVNIGRDMQKLGYVSHDVSSAIESHLDYRFLESLTGKSKSELGF
jgi:ABC-type nitrate/sulfonate/bicarbonate transport system substrate-binding protein